MNPDDLKNVQNPFTLAFVALAVGALVRLLRTKKLNDWLDQLPPSWIKRIPKESLPWVATALAVVICYLDLTLNAKMGWKEAVLPSLFGVFAGSLAVNGHETIAKKIGKLIYKPEGPADPRGPLGPDDPTVDPKDEAKMDATKNEQRSALSSTGGRLVRSGLAIVLLSLTLSGCALFKTVASALPDVIAAVVDGMQVIDAIASFSDRWFANHPNPEAQKTVARAIDRARTSLNVALRLAQGTKNADDQKVNAAFEDFKAAYVDLLQLLRQFGLNVSSANQPGFKVTAGVGGAETLEVPEPIAFRRSVAQ